MAVSEQLPIELECFLMTWGMAPSEYVSGYKPHAPIKHPKTKVKLVSSGWKPTHEGEQPPF